MSNFNIGGYVGEMSSFSAVKPWESLNDLEKREAIARRLGWHQAPHGKYWGKPHWDKKTNTLSPALLPDWPTNDGLAFTEVWPKLEDECGGWLGRSEDGICSVEDYEHKPIATGANWADAICRAAYELLKEAE